MSIINQCIPKPYYINIPPIEPVCFVRPPVCPGSPKKAVKLPELDRKIAANTRRALPFDEPVLKKYKIDPFAQNKRGKTVLMCAAKEGNLEEVKVLLKMGAIVNQQSISQMSALRYAVLGGHQEIVKLLIEHGADLNQLGCGNQSVLDITKMIRGPNCKKIAEVLKAHHPLLSMQCKEYHTRKFLAHCWHISKKSLLINGETKYEIPLEGYFPYAWFNEMRKNVRQFTADYPNYIKNPQMFEEAFSFGADLNIISNEEILKRIKQDKFATFLPIATKEHCGVIFLWNDQLVICNRGQGGRKAIEIFHYDPDLMTEEILCEIDGLKTKGILWYERFIESLPKKLGLSKSFLDKRLECADFFLNQTVGNCSWVSLITAKYAMILLAGIRGESHGRLLVNCNKPSEEDILKQVKIYEKWLTFEQLTSIEKIVDLAASGKSPYLPDHSLIKMGLEKAHCLALDASLSKKRKAITDIYMDSLKPKKAAKFSYELKFWEMIRKTSPDQVIL